jgi:hypothetical protein
MDFDEEGEFEMEEGEESMEEESDSDGPPALVPITGQKRKQPEPSKVQETKKA